MANDDRSIHSAFPETATTRWWIDPTTGAFVHAVHIDGGSSTSPVPVATAGRTYAIPLTVTAGAYSAGDVVGELIIFPNAARETGGGGVIKDVEIIDDAGQDAEMELWLFGAAITDVADNAPWAPTESDLHQLVGIISTVNGAWFAAGTPSAARVECSQRYDCVYDHLYGKLVTRGTPTFAATDDVEVIVGLLQD